MPESRLLESIAERLKSDFGLYPVVAAEIEFYLHGASAVEPFDDAREAFEHALSLHNINAHGLEKERGAEQFEIALKPGNNPYLVGEDTRRLKQVIAEAALRHAMRADFSAKPFADQPGSGLHIHVHLNDAQGRNVFFKENDEYSDHLLHAIGGMLALMPSSMPVFAPARASYARFVSGYNVPVTVSWGANNRTVAIRLPTKPALNKHAEHRVAGADANPTRAIAAILAGVHYGLAKKIPPGEQIFGDAALPMYGLEHLPKDLRSALDAMQGGKILRDYFGTDYCDHVSKEALAAG